MPLQYYLVPNRMTSNPDDYMAISVNRRSYTIEDVYDHMTREGSTLTKAEALASFEEVTQGIINIALRGNTVLTPLVNIMPSLSGVFSSDDDSFDNSRHTINLRMTPGLRMREVPPKIETEKVNGRERMPALFHFYDKVTGAIDDEVTPERGGRIKGSLLKFDDADPNQGIFFVNTADNSETKVEGENLLRNKPSELIFINPALPSGTYRLEVRSILDGNSHVRTGTLRPRVTVA